MKDIQDLKREADRLGVAYPGNIGAATLEDKINKHHLATEAAQEQDNVETHYERTARLRLEANKRTRVIISNLNPLKETHQSTWVIGGNSVVGTIKELVPYNKPWHVCQISLNVLKERKFTVLKNMGGERRETSEVSIEYLDPLTLEEGKRLADQQAIKSQQAV